jgi:hypothetical protein
MRAQTRGTFAFLFRTRAPSPLEPNQKADGKGYRQAGKGQIHLDYLLA